VAAVDTFMVLFATQVFVLGRAGSASLGLFYGCFGLGAALGPLLANRANDGTPRRMRRLIVAGSALIALGILLLGAAPSLALACVGICLRGAGGSINWTMSTIILQKTVPDGLRGRVFSLDFASFPLMAASFSLVWGALVDGVGLRPVVLLAGALVLLPLGLWTACLGWMDRRERAAA
jgi:MFS family permease